MARQMMRTMSVDEALELFRKSKGDRLRPLDQRKVDRYAADMRGVWTPPQRAGGESAGAAGGPAGA